MYELIIIGAGPAGITASIYAARKKMDFLVIAKEVGGQTNWTLNVENYTGFQMISGRDLVANFRKHLSGYGDRVKEGESVRSVEKAGEAFKVKTNKGEYEAKALVITSGKINKVLNVPGENRLRNKGVFYCATCDAPIFQDADVVVVGGGNSGLDAVLQLEKIAKKIYLVDSQPKLMADHVLVEKAKSSPKVEVLVNTRVLEILGDKFVSGIRVEHEGKERTIPAEGVFIEIGWTPSSDFIENIAKNPKTELMINCNSETSIEGVFAAGDVTSVPAKQIIVSCGEGAKAVLAAFEYLNRKE
jgi:NADH-dependent peroxiredoxin subunit F